MPGLVPDRNHLLFDAKKAFPVGRRRYNVHSDSCMAGSFDLV
jgi:hypothetical protein